MGKVCLARLLYLINIILLLCVNCGLRLKRQNTKPEIIVEEKYLFMYVYICFPINGRQIIQIYIEKQYPIIDQYFQKSIPAELLWNNK